MSNITKKMLEVIKDVPTIDEIMGAQAPELRLRTPWVPGGEERLFDMKKRFNTVYETSTFLDGVAGGVEYIQMTVMSGSREQTAHNVAWFDAIGRDGYVYKGVRYRIIFGDWDDKGIAILVDETKIKGLEDLGLKLKINSASDMMKVRKYTRRIRAFHEWALFGEIYYRQTTKHGEVLSVYVDNPDKVSPNNVWHIEFDMLHVELGSLATKYDVALADGIHLIDVELCHKLGELLDIEKLKNMTVGDAFKGTAVSVLGLGKGFFQVVKNSEFGIILYGPKAQVSLDTFYLGSLGDAMASGEAYTDLQSLINFDYWKDDIFYDSALLFMKKVHAAMSDDDKLRHLILTHLDYLPNLLEDQTENGKQRMALVEAVRCGVPLKKYSNLRTKAERMLLQEVLDTQRGRVPYQKAGARFNLMPDLHCFQNAAGRYDGSVDYKRSLVPEDCVVAMDLNQGPIFMHRQPTGHKKEGIMTTCIHKRQFKAFRGRNVIILGYMAWYYLSIMGGGDMDDAVVATDDVRWIEVMQAGDYPYTAFTNNSADVAESENHWETDDVYPRLWDMRDFFDANAKATDSSINLGMVVNAVMMDVLLSGEHKEHMLSQLADMIVDAAADRKEFLRNKYDWLRNRPEYLLREAGSNLEAIIDYIKLGKGDLQVILPLIKLVKDVTFNSEVVPASYMMPDEDGKVRASAYLLDKKEHVVLSSLMCEQLARVAKEVALLQSALITDKWLSVDSIPDSLNKAFPRDRVVALDCRTLRSAWGEQFVGKKDIKQAYGIAVKTVLEPFFMAPEFDSDDDDLRMQMAVEIARQVYPGRKTEVARNADGSKRQYPDSLLWTNTVGLYYIKALEQAGLTGLYVPVEFTRWSRNYAEGSYSVVIKAGWVSDGMNDMLIGCTRTANAEDGSYVMTNGMVCIQEPAEELARRSNEVNQEPVDRTAQVNQFDFIP